MILFFHIFILMYSYSPITNICESKLSCVECLRASSLCSWCKKQDFKNLRCNTKANLTNQMCGVDNILEFNSYTTLGEEIVNDYLKINHGKISAVFRQNEALEFEITVRVIKNKDVHLGILLDNSRTMASVHTSLIDLAGNLGNMGQGSVFTKVGVAQFVDKCQHPIINLNQYDSLDTETKPFNYRIVQPLTDVKDAIKTSLARTKNSINIDLWENIGEAIIQTAVCKQFGWDEDEKISRTIIVFTDALPKLAGAGIIIGVLKPNDMKCHLNSNLNDGKGLDQDYPTLPMIGYVLNQNKTDIIFAVSSELMETYKMITKSWKGVRSSVVNIKATSDEIKTLLADTRKELDSNIQITFVETNDIKITVTPTASCKSIEGSACNSVEIDQPVTFKIKAEAKNIINPNIITFSVSHMNQFEFEYKLFDDCKCNDPLPSINCGTGIFKCGICECPSNKGGNLCQCNLAEQNINRCINLLSGEICSNRGFCDSCSSCVCYTASDGKPFDGKHCECSRSECKIVNGVICGGDERGKCNCESCECKEDFYGKNCEFEKCTSLNMKKKCKKTETDKQLCSGNGTCLCGICACNPKRAGTHCEKEIRSVDCDFFEQSVFCAADIKTDKKSKECLNQIHTITISEQEKKYSCIRSSPDNCRYYFNYVKKNPNNEEDQIYLIRVKKIDRENDCDAPVNIILITVGTFLGIVSIGIILFLIYFASLYIYYRNEFKKFKKEINRQSEGEENPLFEPIAERNIDDIDNLVH